MQLVFLNIMYYCKTIPFISNWIPQRQRAHAFTPKHPPTLNHGIYKPNKHMCSYIRTYDMPQNATRICALPLHINNLHHHHHTEWSTFCEYLLFIVCLPCFAIATFPVFVNSGIYIRVNVYVSPDSCAL